MYPATLKVDTSGRYTLLKFMQVIKKYDPSYKSELISSLCRKDISNSIKKYLLEFKPILIENENSKE